jgi:hypothetical protein
LETYLKRRKKNGSTKWFKFKKPTLFGVIKLIGGLILSTIGLWQFYLDDEKTGDEKLIIINKYKQDSIKSEKILNNTYLQLETAKTIIDEQNKLLHLSNSTNRILSEPVQTTQSLVKLSDDIRNLNTGGSSFPNLRHTQVTFFDDGVHIAGAKVQLNFNIYNEGIYPIDDFKVRIFEIPNYRNIESILLWQDVSLSGLNIRSRFPNLNTTFSGTAVKKPLSGFDINVFKPEQSQLAEPIFYKTFFESTGFNILCESNRQSWIILLRLFMPRKDQPFVLQAYKVLKVIDGHLEQTLINIDPGFPLNNKGQVQWFKDELPMKW